MKHSRIGFWSRSLAILSAVLVLTAGCGGKSEPAAQPKSDTAPKAAAQPEVKKPTTLQELAQYQGPDRDQILLEGAKKEGKLTLYSSMPQEDMGLVTDAFTKKYGIPVTLWRGDSEAVRDRVLAEAKAKRYELDVVETNGPEMEVLNREKLLQPVTSPIQKDLVDGAVVANKGWAATRLNLFVQAYNTKSIKKEDLPKTWEDLLNPRWKGLLTVEEADFDWFAGLMKYLGEEKGLKLFTDIGKANGFGVRKGHSLITQLVSAGEVPFALTTYSYIDESQKKKGAPIDWFAIQPAFARPNGTGVSVNAAHPHAALLFYDWLIGEGQKVMVTRNIVVTNTQIDPVAKNTPMKMIDPGVILDETQKWQKLWDENVIKFVKK